MVFIHHVLLLVLQVIFIHTGLTVAQRNWILAEGDEVALPERCPRSSENPVSSLTATELINGASNLSATETIYGASNLSAAELINGASSLSATEIIDGASNLSTTAEVINGDIESNLTATDSGVINGDTESSLTATDSEVIKRRVAQVFTSSPEILVIGPECPDQPTKPITAEDAGLYCCQDGTNNRISVSVLSRSPQTYDMTPGSTVSFGCELVTAKGACMIDSRVRLRWVGVEGNPIQEQEGTISRSSCMISLTVIVQNEDSRVFLCRAYRGSKLKATLTFPERPPAIKGGKGRRGGIGFGPDPNSDFGSEVDPRPQGDGNGGVVVVLVGVVSCVALTTMLTLFVVKRRQSNRPLPANSDNIHSNICSDDVIYANLDLPMASGVLIPPKQEESEYAAIRTHNLYDQ